MRGSGGRGRPQRRRRAHCPPSGFHYTKRPCTHSHTFCFWMCLASLRPTPRPTHAARLQGRSHRRLCESAGDAESVVEDERMVARVMPGPAHLHDPKLTLHPELALPREPEVEDSVDEVILFVLCICRPAWIAPSGSVRRKLSQQEGRAVQI